MPIWKSVRPISASSSVNHDPPASGAVTGINLWRYRLPLKRPLRVGDFDLDHRSGLLLEWRQFPDRSVWSEIAPLPGFSQESLDTCIAECRRFFASHSIQCPDTRPNRPIPQSPAGAALARELAAEMPETTTTDEIRKALDHQSSPLSPSVLFALESGLLQLTETLPSPPFPRVCQLILPGTSIDAAALIIANCVKLKVGRDNPETERNELQRLIETLPPAVRFRVDANRAWTREQTIAFCSGLDPARIEYLEEPLRPGLSYTGWAEQMPIPFAWDETLREQPDADLDTPGLRTVVLKPMLTGLSRTRTLVEQARARGLQVVLSGAFESNLSLDLYARLAAWWSLEGPHGLDTFRSFGMSLLQPPNHFPSPESLPILRREQLEHLGQLL